MCKQLRFRQLLNSLLIVAALLATSTFARAASDSSLSLVKDGKTSSTIVVPKDADEWTSKAAQWLQEYVRKASGAELRIVSEDYAPTGTLISVGHTKLAAKAGIDVSDLKWDGCKLIVRDNVLYLIGRDQTKVVKTHPWVGAKGTCRAVLKFLEDVCGVRWFLPSSEGELVPQNRNISVAADLSISFTPAFAYTDGRSTYNTDYDHPFGIMNEPGGTPASMANNFRKAVLVATGGHTYYASVPAEHFKEHPEYFALIDGKRTANGHHLCSSNPDVKRMLVEFTRKRFDEGWEWQSLGQEDGYRRCECPECEKLDDYRFEDGEWGSYEEFMNKELRDHPCERVLLLHKAVIDEVKKSHPDKKVNLMCYAPTAWPSKKIEYFGDNVVAEVMHPDAAYIAAWRGKTSGMLGKTDWFNTQCPMGANAHMSPKELAHRVRHMHESGLVGFSQYAEANWGIQGPLFYTLGRLMGDPFQDEQALVNEYCQGVYGKAGDTMREFLNLIYDRVEETVPAPDDDIILTGRNVSLGLSRKPTEVYLTMYPPEFLRKLDDLLKKAEAEADTDRARGWVRLSRDQFDFIKLLTESLISYRDYESKPTKDKWLEMKQRVADFDTHRWKILNYSKEYTDVWFPGYVEFCKYISGGAVKETISYYVPWEQRQAEVLRKGIKGVAVGHGDSYYYSFFKEPLTLDFDQPPSNLQ